MPVGSCSFQSVDLKFDLVRSIVKCITLTCFSMSSHSAVAPFSTKRPRLSGNSGNIMNERELSAETMRAMQSIRAKADALRQKLCTTVTGDSHAMTWFTANEMLELNASDQSCRELAEAVYSEIDALCSLQSLKEKVSRASRTFPRSSAWLSLVSNTFWDRVAPNCSVWKPDRRLDKLNQFRPFLYKK